MSGVESGAFAMHGSRLQADTMPPILAGQATLSAVKRVDRFYFSVAAIFEAWVNRRQSRHTQRAYRQDVTALVKFLKIDWPDRGAQVPGLFTGTVGR